jgi:mTERF domain-containing protein, mitochondrial
LRKGQHCSAIALSFERRLMLRYFRVKVLREKGLLNAELDHYSTISVGEKMFVQKFVHPYKDHVPGLTDDYASMCSRMTA